jgi:maltose alpha-D-glucosyltransferase/alpha-amylase
MFDAAALLGQCTAEMHLALTSSADRPAFAPEPMSVQDLASDAERIESQIKSTLEALKMKLASLDDASTDITALLLSRRPELLERARSIAALKPSGLRIRIHGDYHLGQTLRTASADSTTRDGDFVLIDFEGEPARPIEERRRKQSPLRDVAGMLRSFSYVAWSALDRVVTTQPDKATPETLSAWAEWWQNAAAAQFLQAYEKAAAKNPVLLPAPKLAQPLLKAYLLEKALYEVLYELNNRPTWLRIPMKGILTL